VQVEYASPDGKPATRPMDEFILRRPSLKPLRKEHWVYTGSCEAIDPTTGGKTNQACLTLAIIGLHYTDGSPLIQNSRDDARNENIYVADEKALPEANTPVKLVIRRVAAKVPDGTQRLAVTVSGQVGGVGYAQFAQCQARLRGLRGMAQESGDDRCEIELEGKQAAIDEVVAELKAGPRGAKVKSVATTQIAPQGGPDQFNIR
jgi:acylphosphatase